jgi:spore germination protein
MVLQLINFEGKYGDKKDHGKLERGSSLMERQHRQITIIQTAIILISAIVGVGVLALSLFAVRAADTGAPLVTLFGFLVGLFGLWSVTKLGMRFPSQSIIQYSEDLIGKTIARIFSLMIIAFFAFSQLLLHVNLGKLLLLRY